MTGADVKNVNTSDSNARNPWGNTNHTLHLHHSDQPGAVLVTQTLMEDNFTVWSQSMKDALKVKNKLGFVLVTQIKPKINEEELQQWERCDTLVKTWLVAAMSKPIASSVRHCKTSRDVWVELSERFLQTNIVQLFNIEHVIHDCLQGAESVTGFYTRLKALWDDKDALCNLTPCTCELTEYMQNQKTMKFLMGLNDSYDILRSNIVAIDPLTTVNKAYSVALRHEKQAATSNNNKQSSQAEGAAFSVKQNYQDEGEYSKRDPRPNEREVRCEKCGKRHQTKNCRQHLKCTYCKWRGHVIEDCNKRKRDEDKKSRSNHIDCNDLSESDISFTLSKEVCGKIVRALSQHKDSTANNVGNNSHFDNLSGPSLGEDDWDEN